MRTVIAAAIIGSAAPLGPLVAQSVGVGSPTTLRSAAVRDSALANAIVNARVLGERNLDKATGLMIRVLSLAGESGSARTEESDEVTSWLYVGVSESGEAPEQRAYRIGPVYDPRVDRIVAEGRTAVVYLAYGAASARRHARIAVDLAGVHVAAAR